MIKPHLLLALAASLGAIAFPAHGKPDLVISDFEGGTYGDWVVAGNALGAKPANGTLEGQQVVRGYLGKGLVNTFIDGDGPTGTLTSPAFDITRDHLSFLIGGGQHPGETGMELWVGGRAVRAATGLDEEQLRWRSWDVREYAGKVGHLLIYDRASGGFGHINIDHIVLGDRPKGNAPIGHLADYRKTPLYYRERYRPQYHFTPPMNWMNDPNGMVFYDGEWHLFYQHNPHGNTWGHMSWGHAVSKDLVHWEHLPIALQDHYGVMIFSGSAVVDWKNTSGFGTGKEPPLVAIYTGHGHGKQTQDLAYSNDKGRTWTKFAGNPVIDLNKKDFRDPKVIWHEASEKWIMAVAMPLEHQVRFYSSPDLKKWEHLSDFGPAGATGGIWECPDLFPLAVDGAPANERWVLLVNLNPGGPAGGSACQYFVGDFDGTRFQLDPSYPTARPAEQPGPEALWLDHGADCYAAVTWSDVPESDGRRITIGWMSNWQYAGNIPTYPWRSAMTVPRVLSLKKRDAGLRLVQSPVVQLQKLRRDPVQLANFKIEAGATSLRPHRISGSRLEILAEFEVGQASEFGFRVRKGAGEETVVGYDPQKREVFIDRSKSGEVEFHGAFAGRHAGPLSPQDGRVRLHLFVDDSSVEVFANDGSTVITDRIFPSPESTEVELYSSGAATQALSIHAWKLASAWRKD